MHAHTFQNLWTQPFDAGNDLRNNSQGHELYGFLSYAVDSVDAPLRPFFPIYLAQMALYSNPLGVLPLSSVKVAKIGLHGTVTKKMYNGWI